MTGRAILRPLFGLAVLLLTFAVVAMHQLGAGHTPPMSLGHVGHATLALGPGSDPGLAPTAGQSPAPEMSELSQLGCAAGCADSAHEPPTAGHGGSMLCLAVLPLLLALVARRAALLTRWLRVFTEVGAPSAALTRPAAVAPGPPGPCLIRLCVSRT